MLILSAEDVRRALPMGQAIEAMKQAYGALSGGKAEMPLRTRLPISPHEGLSLFMPAYVQAGGAEALGVKVVSIFPRNPGRGLALIQAAVLVLEPDTGRTLALLEGSALTAIRTGAAGGAAADVLARLGSRVVAIFGAGPQARAQLEAVCTVRQIERVLVYDPHPDRAAAFKEEMGGRGRIPRDIQLAADPAQAVADADIICTATTASTPVFADIDLKPGVHINAIGSYTPEMQEVPAETLGRATVVVDSRAACLAEAGDLIWPIRAGLFDEGHIHAELGEIVLGRKPGRRSDGEITYFKSVGLAVQDALAAHLALKNATDMRLGQTIPF